MTESAIDVKDLTKCYGELLAVDGVSFDVSRKLTSSAIGLLMH